MIQLQIVLSRMEEEKTALRVELNSVREGFNCVKVELGKTHERLLQRLLEKQIVNYFLSHLLTLSWGF